MALRTPLPYVSRNSGSIPRAAAAAVNASKSLTNSVTIELGEQFRVDVAVLSQRPDALGVVGLERLDFAQKLVEPRHGTRQVADRHTREYIDVHVILLGQ